MNIVEKGYARHNSLLMNYETPFFDEIDKQIEISLTLDHYFDIISNFEKDNNSIVELSSYAKKRILDSFFNENSSYKSYYQQCNATLSELISKEMIGDGDWVLSSDMDDNGEYSLVQLKHIGSGEFLNKPYCKVNNSFFVDHNCNEIKEGYLLINRIISDAMNVCILPSLGLKTITSVDVCWIAPNDSLYNQKYLMYLLLSPQFQQQVLLRCSGSTRQRISRKKLTTIEFRIHDRSIQDEIVEKIENRFDLLNQISS